MYSYKLSDHELQPTRWEHCSSTSPHGGSWDEVHRSLRKGGIRQPSLKSTPTPSLPLLKPNISMWGHQIVTPSYREWNLVLKGLLWKGPGTSLEDSSMVNSEDSHVCNIPWCIKLDSCQPQTTLKSFWLSVSGHECFSNYNNTKINEKDQTLKRFSSLPWILRSHLQKVCPLQSDPDCHGGGKGVDWGLSR